MLISIIVPVYNTASYLEKCLNSIIRQTYKNLEIIIVNDGSTDNSLEICKEFEKRDTRIKVLNKSNGGLSSARNLGLKYANGNFIGFVDSDDWVSLNMFENLINLAVRNKLDIVECDYINSIDLKVDVNEIPLTAKFQIENSHQTITRIIKSWHYSVCKKIFKRSILNDLQFQEGIIYEDVLYSLDAVIKSKRIGYIGHPFYVYYMENSSIMRSPFRLNNLDIIEVFKEQYFLAKRNKLQAEVVEIARSRFLDYLQNSYYNLYKYSHLDPDYIYRNRVRFYIKEFVDLKSPRPLILAKFLSPKQILLILELKRRFGYEG